LTVGILKITKSGLSLSEHGALSAIPTREGIALSEQERAKQAIVQ